MTRFLDTNEWIDQSRNSGLGIEKLNDLDSIYIDAIREYQIGNIIELLKY